MKLLHIASAAPALAAAAFTAPCLAQATLDATTTIAIERVVDAPDPFFPLTFGEHFAVSGDHMLVHWIAAPSQRRIYAFEQDANGSWSEAQQLADPSTNGTAFGPELDVDGARAIVAGVQNTSGGAFAFEFELQGDGTWSAVSELVLGLPGVAEVQADSLDLSGDRVAARLDVEFQGGGAAVQIAVIFERQGDGSWALASTLDVPAALLPPGESPGRPIIDGDRAALGLPGGIYAVFERQVGGAWMRESVLVPQPGHGPDADGFAALDGDLLLVARPEAGGIGALDLYGRAPAGGWSLAGTTYAPAGGADADQFGVRAALEGQRVVVTALGNQDPNGDRNRYLIVYDVEDGGTLLPQVVVEAADPDGSLIFANRIQLDGGSLFVSHRDAIFDPPGVEDPFETGAVYGVRDITTLARSTDQVSLVLGGSQHFEIRGGVESAGDLFVVFGSLSGTFGATPVPGSGVTLPFVADAYTDLVLLEAGAGLIVPWVGLLDANGDATSRFTLPPGAPLDLLGATVHHAVLTFDLATFTPHRASNAVGAWLVP